MDKFTPGSQHMVKVLLDTSDDRPIWFQAWGRKYMREEYPINSDLMTEYYKPIWRWADALQNNFAARADWCVKSYDDANHSPEVKIYINETKEKEGVPILCTSIVRRHFKEDGTLKDTHGHYLTAARRVAKETQVYFIDMEAKTNLK